MARREILVYPEAKESLRKHSEPVQRVDKRVRRLIRDLQDTLRSKPEGVGLAAPQIDVHLRVLVYQPEETRSKSGKPAKFSALINPEILESHDEQKDFDGCLSFPGLFGETIRPHYLKISFINLNGEEVVKELIGFDAVVVHHEMDHLDGILFIDRIKDINDLYRIDYDDDGNPIKVPIGVKYASFISRG